MLHCEQGLFWCGGGGGGIGVFMFMNMYNVSWVHAI